MQPDEIEAILSQCEQALKQTSGPIDLKSLGFWRAVGAVKRDRPLVRRYAERIGTIDQQAFERAVWPTFPPAVGGAVLSIGMAAGLFLAAATYAVPERWKGPTLVVATGALLGSTHGLAHFLVGRLFGIRFTHWFLNGPVKVQPSIKIDYASYLRSSPRRRAWMHASGAIVTKIIPFALIPATAGSGVPRWSLGILAGIGVVQLLTDALFSVHHSDWKRFRREIRLAK